MKRKYFLLAGACLLSAVFLWSCGNGPGAPGSSGSENTGIEIQSVGITVNSNPGNAGPDLDANVHICPSGTAEPGLFRDEATLTITTSVLNPGTGTGTVFDPFPASVEECIITYKQPTDELGAPVIEQWKIFPNCTLNSGSNLCVVNLIDITRKREQFWNNVCAVTDPLTGFCTKFFGAVNDPQKMPTRYVASYDCKYVNHVGESGHFQVELEIFLADFELCG